MHKQAGAIESDVRILGPAPAPVTRLKGKFRYHLQLAHADVERIHQLWQETVKQLPRAKEVEFIIDVDPYNLR